MTFLEIRDTRTGSVLFERPVDDRIDAEKIVEDFFNFGASCSGIEFVYVEYDENYNELEVMNL